MTTVAKQVREALRTELDGWDILPGLSWSTDALPPGSVDDTGEAGTSLPLASLWWGSAVALPGRSKVVALDEDGRAVWQRQRKQAAFQAKIWTGSEADYDAAQEAFEGEAFVACVNSNATDQRYQDLTVTIETVEANVRVLWTGEQQFADPSETGKRNLWMASYSGVISYPDLYRESEAGATGALDVTVQVDDEPEIPVEDLDPDAPGIPTWEPDNPSITFEEVE